jgi:hypothetical protein
MGTSRVGCQDVGGMVACLRPRGEFLREVLCSSAKVRGLGVLGSLRCGRGCDAARLTWTANACRALVGELLSPRARHACASCCGNFDLTSPMRILGSDGENISAVEGW